MIHVVTFTFFKSAQQKHFLSIPDISQHILHIAAFDNEQGNSQKNDDAGNCLNNRDLGTESSCLATVGTGGNKWAGMESNHRHTDFQSDVPFVSTYFEGSYNREIGFF